MKRRNFIKHGALWVPTLLLPRKSFSQLGLQSPGFVGQLSKKASSAYSFTVEAATFDGTNDGLTRDYLSGVSNAKTATFSFWVKMNGGNLSSQFLFAPSVHSTDTSRCAVNRDASNHITIICRNADPTNILVANGSTAITDATGWVHVFVYFDLANSANRGMYINGAAETVTWTTYINAAYHITGAGLKSTVAQSYSGGSKGNCCLSEMWFSQEYVTDVSKFYSGGEPVDLGADGSTPTGSQPAVYLSGDYTSFQTNAGFGGDYTVDGSLTDCTAP